MAQGHPSCVSAPWCSGDGDGGDGLSSSRASSWPGSGDKSPASTVKLEKVLGCSSIPLTAQDGFTFPFQGWHAAPGALEWEAAFGASPALVPLAQGTATAPSVAVDCQPGQISSFPPQSSSLGSHGNSGACSSSGPARCGWPGKGISRSLLISLQSVFWPPTRHLRG